MRRLFLSAVLLASAIFAVAQSDFRITEEGKRRVVVGSKSFERPDEEIFGNIILWAFDRGVKKQDDEAVFDYDMKTLSMPYSFIDSQGIVTFSAHLQLKVSNGRLNLLIDKIAALQSGFSSFIGNTLNFDRLNPDKKPKHKEIIVEFEKGNRMLLQNLFDFINNHEIEITDWKNVASNRLQKSMSVDEVILIMGQPIDIQEAGNGVTRLMFSSSSHVFIENGKVKSFIR